jgi:hypothetical protein
MRAAQVPTGPGAATGVGVLLALLLTAAGVVAVHDALIYAHLLHGRAWLSTAAKTLDGVRPASWMVPAGAALILLGLWLVVTALRPRPRKATALTATTGVFLRPKDVARLAETAVDDVSGVLHSRVSANRRVVDVHVTGTGDPNLPDRVHAAVVDRLAPLQTPPKVRVRTQGVRS